MSECRPERCGIQKRWNKERRRDRPVRSTAVSLLPNGGLLYVMSNELVPRALESKVVQSFELVAIEIEANFYQTERHEVISGVPGSEKRMLDRLFSC